TGRDSGSTSCRSRRSAPTSTRSISFRHPDPRSRRRTRLWPSKAGMRTIRVRPWFPPRFRYGSNPSGDLSLVVGEQPFAEAFEPHVHLLRVAEQLSEFVAPPVRVG